MAITKDLNINDIGEFDPDIAGGPLTIRFPNTNNLVHGLTCAIFNTTTSATAITLEKSNISTTDKIMDPADRSNIVGTVSGLVLSNYGYVRFTLDIYNFPNKTWVWVIKN
jgi:hypothetical protein